MAGDVWRWCQVHQKWLQDVNVKVTPRGLQNDRGDSGSHSNLSTSSSSYSSDRPECLEPRMGRNAAASGTRWQDDGRIRDPVPPSPGRFKSNKQGGSPALQEESGVALGSLPRVDLALEDAADVGNNVRPRANRPVKASKWLFQDDSLCAEKLVYDENVIAGQNWVTVFSSNPVGDGTGGETIRLRRDEFDQVLREFAKCGTITKTITEPSGANWVQIQYQSPREAGLALMKSGLRLKGGLQVVVRSLDESQRKQLLVETTSKCGNQQLSPHMPMSCDPDATPKDEGPPKSSVSKFVDLVFDCGRDYQISPAGHIIPIRFEPGLYKELFKWQVHSCDAFVTPLCDPAANLPLYFEYPRKLVEPCEYAQNKLDELRTMVGGELAARCSPSFQHDSEQRFCACSQRPARLP